MIECLNLLCRLKPIDVKFMKMLHEKVNIVPVIGKADSLTKTEIGKLKKKVSSNVFVLGFFKFYPFSLWSTYAPYLVCHFKNNGNISEVIL